MVFRAHQIQLKSFFVHMEIPNQNVRVSPVTPVAVALRFGLLLAVGWVLVDFLIRVVGLGFMSYGIVSWRPRCW